MPFSTSLPWDVIWSPPWIMLLIFPSNFAIGFSVLQTIYRSFFFSCSPLGNQKWATVIRLLFLRSWSKPDTSSFLILSPLSPCCCCIQGETFLLHLCCNDSGNAQVMWCQICPGWNLLCWINEINSSSSLHPRVSWRALWHVLSAQLEVLLSEGFSLRDCLLNLHIRSIWKALGSHWPLVSQERHPKALGNV